MPEIRFPAYAGVSAEQRTQIFRLQPPNVNERALREFARRLGLRADLKSGSLQQDQAKITYTEGSLAVTVYRASGAVRYHDRTRWQVDDGKSHVNLDDRDAEEIARRFVQRFGLVPLEECRLLKITRLRVGTVERETLRAEERIIDVGVAFQRTIGGVPVDGPGGKMIVYIDHEGEVTGFDRLWRGIRDIYRQVDQLRSPEFARDQLSRYWRQHDSSRIDVREVRFGYFELGWRATQRYLQPAYILLLTLISTDERFHKNSVYVIPAATNAIGKLTPSPKRPSQQPPRVA